MQLRHYTNEFDTGVIARCAEMALEGLDQVIETRQAGLAALLTNCLADLQQAGVARRLPGPAEIAGSDQSPGLPGG